MALGGAVTAFEALRAHAASGIRGAIEAFEHHLIILEDLQHISAPRNALEMVVVACPMLLRMKVRQALGADLRCVHIRTSMP